MLTSADITNLRMAVVHLRATAHHDTSMDALATADAIVALIDREYQQQDAETTEEWGIRRPNMDPHLMDDEAEARRVVRSNPKYALIRRLVGPWEVAS